MMNILHVVPYYAPAWAFGGVARAAAGLAEAQAAAGHRVTVLTTDALDRSRRIDRRSEVLAGVSVVRVRNASIWLRGRLNLSSPIGLGAAARRLIEAGPIDLVHAHELRTAENLLAGPAAARFGRPLVVSPHGTLSTTTGRASAKRLWDRAVGRRWMGGISQVVALTEQESEEARELWARLGIPLRDEQIAIVPNGVDFPPPGSAAGCSAFRERWGLGERPVVLYLGRLAARKGLALLVSAFGEVARRFPEAVLLLAGPDEGMARRLRDQARAEGIAPRVVFPGLLTEDSRWHALLSAQVMALPATGEGLPLAALEALACGLPIVLSEGCNFPEAAEAGAGFVVPAAAGPLAETLGGLLQDAPLRTRMGQKGRDLVASGYTWAHVADRIAAVYQAVLAREGRSGG